MASRDGAKRADFEEWVAARYPALLRFAVLTCGSQADAEDACQSALAKLWLAWDRVRSRDALEAYARKAVLNEQRQLWRRAWFKRERTSDSLPERVSEAGECATDRAVWDFLQTLPTRQRAVLVLRYYEDLSEAEIADALGISPGTVKSQASKGLAGLRRALADHPSNNPWSDDE
jgi:RNA polymerase sigma-70 factor (sigma-E family)